MKLKDYLELSKQTQISAARELGCTRQHLGTIVNGAPAGRKLGVKILQWSKGAVGLDDVCYPISATKIDKKK